MLSQPQIAELTVEDPAEAFEDLRDRNDLRMLLGLDKFMAEAFGEGAEGHSVSHGNNIRRGKGKGKGKMGPPVEKGWAEKWRVDLKIAGVCCALLFRSATHDSSPRASAETIQSLDRDATITLARRNRLTDDESLPASTQRASLSLQLRTLLLRRFP